MDKKRTQRILGILVIIALVIILFPLLSGKSEQPTGDTTALKNPQFPEPPPPPSAIAAEDNTQDNAQDSTQDVTPSVPTDTTASANPGTNPDEENTVAPQDLSQATPNSPLPEAQTSEDVAPAISMDMKNRPNTEISALQPSTSANAPAAAPPVKIMDAPEKVIENATPPKAKAVVSQKKRISDPTKSVHKTEKDLAQLTAKAWVVQMGSFKDKSNAKHLADTLRSAGYKAFTHDVKSRNGTMRTRVYIGPEYKQTAAMNLSTKIEQEMMLHGIIVAYQPLTM